MTTLNLNVVLRRSCVAVVGAAWAISATIASAQMRPGSGPAPRPVPIAVEYGGFEVDGSQSDCEASIEQAIRSTDLGITLTGVPDRIAGTMHVSVGIACLATVNTHVWRVVVVSASTDPTTAEFYRNDVRARIQQYSHHQSLTGVGGVAPMGGAAAPISMCAFAGAGPQSDMQAARAAAAKLGYSAVGATSGGEIALVAEGATVVVATSLFKQAGPGLASAVQQSWTMGFGASADGERGKLACSAVRTQMTTPSPLYVR